MSTSLSNDQEEEKEVLISIYDSDPNFKETGPTTFQYKVGEVGVTKTFLVEVTWTAKYPEEYPIISLDSFYNRHLSPQTRKNMTTAMLNEVEILLGSPMTYTLFEYCRDNVDELIPDEELCTEQEEPDSNSPTTTTTRVNNTTESVKKSKGEVLSKAAKRRQADRLNAQGEMPRGWNWVDIIKHLSKTGGKD